jgi:hypothetical protein
VPPVDGDVKLEDALVQAFAIASFSRMLRHQLGIVLEREVNTQQGFKYVVGDLVQVAAREQWRDDLVRGALADNPKHPLLWQAAAVLHVSPAQPVSTPAGPIAAADLGGGRLEKMARERGISVSHRDYMEKLSAIGRQMCSIEVPEGNPFGTGWLVGPDLVLTNYHVVQEIRENKVAASDVTCRFDYAVQGATGVPCGLAPRWLEDWSPNALADIRADAPEPTADEVDYALVRLARPMGDEKAADGAARGWVHVNAAPPVVIADDLLMVPQFPGGQGLSLSFGKALAYNNAATRLRYDANTEQGASGSPCVTMKLEPFGLHHASGPGRSLRYNQCVPLRLVIQRLTRQGIPPFWSA